MTPGYSKICRNLNVRLNFKRNATKYRFPKAEIITIQSLLNLYIINLYSTMIFMNAFLP
jgi:hypothetical protein